MKSTWRSIHPRSSSLTGRRFGLPVFVPRTGELTVLPFTALLTLIQPSW